MIDDVALANVISEPNELMEIITWTSWNQSNDEFNPDQYRSQYTANDKESGFAQMRAILRRDSHYNDRGWLFIDITGGNDSLSVLLMHGFFNSSADWIVPGKDKALPYPLLANQGYDIWLGNFRGNSYSKAHISLSLSESKFGISGIRIN
ncbi:Lipase 1 [Camponotus japonicus]